MGTETLSSHSSVPKLKSPYVSFISTFYQHPFYQPLGAIAKIDIYLQSLNRVKLNSMKKTWLDEEWEDGGGGGGVGEEAESWGRARPCGGSWAAASRCCAGSPCAAGGPPSSGMPGHTCHTRTACSLQNKVMLRKNS